MIIKVCGLREVDNIRAVAALPVQWLGFILYDKSPRYVGQDFAGRPIDTAGKISVGVSVDMLVEALLARADSFPIRFDYLQLHGHESPEYCERVRRSGYGVIKAFSIATQADLQQTAVYESHADYFLFDTRCEGFGGSGRSFDWSLLAAYQGRRPFLLSGGLNPGSIAALRSFHHPAWCGIDLNSGFETSPAVKDISKLQEFIGKESLECRV